MSQCHVDQPRRRQETHVDDETYSDSELIEEMSKLDINLLVPSSPIVSTQRRRAPPQTTSSMRSTPTAERGYHSLNSIEGRPWKPEPKLYGMVQKSSKYPNMPGGGRGSMWRRHQQSDESALSSELISAIFRNTTKTIGGRRLALLHMDGSGRWRLVQIDKAPETFPNCIIS